MKNKQYLVLLIGFLMLVMSFFLLKKNDSITTKKLKELNYDVTYLEAFPDKNLRRGIILCIMRNKCGEDDYNSGAYEYEKYNDSIQKWPSTSEYFNKYYQTIIFNSNYGPTIYDHQLNLKEREKIKKEDLEKIKVLLSNEFTKNVNSLQGIEYLTNLKAVVLHKVMQEDIDFSYNKKLEKLYINVVTHDAYPRPIKNINLNQNIKLKELAIKLDKNDSILDYSNLTNLETIILQESKIKTILLPSSAKIVDLSNNNIKEINLKNNSNNIEKLNMQSNPITSINIDNLVKLKYINLNNTKLKNNINFSKNIDIEEVYIGSQSTIKIESLDFSHNLKLKKLTLSAELKNLNLDNVTKLDFLYLINNSINELDLTKNPKLGEAGGSISLGDNHISNLKVNSNLSGGTYQTLKFKIKKNAYQNIPIYYNNQKVELNNNTSFIKKDGKYLFTTLGTFNERAEKTLNNFTYSAGVVVEVEAGEESSFNPEIDQKDYMPLLNEEITKEAIKKMITNLPDNIKDFEIVDPKPTIFNSNAKQKIRVRVTFSDDTFKEFDVLVNVYKVNYIPPTGRIIPNPVEVIEGKAVNISITRTYEKENYIDEVNLIKYVQDEIINYHHDNVPSGVVFNGNGYNGVINYIFTGTEEEHTFVISHSEDTKSGGPGWSDRIQVKLLRDTDGDGIPDIKDDDKDGDGYSNAVEIAKGSNPYNKNSTPDMTKKKQLDELVKDLEKLINNTKNNPFNNKNKLDVDNLKNNVLPDKENKKNDIKNSYTDSTSDTDLENLKQKVEKEIDNLKKEINKLRDKANFEELDKEKAKPIEEDIYTPESVKPLKDKIEEANKISRDTATQEDVDNMTKIIKYLRDKLVIDRTKLKNKIDELEKAIEENKCITEECKKTLEEAKELYTKTNITKEEILDMIKRIDLLLNKKIVFKNPKTGILSYSLVIIFIILISIFLIKQKKNYIR